MNNAVVGPENLEAQLEGSIALGKPSEHKEREVIAAAFAQIYELRQQLDAAKKEAATVRQHAEETRRIVDEAMDRAGMPKACR